MTHLHPKDLRVDVISGGPLAPVCVQIVYLPTGHSAMAVDTSRMRAREQAMDKLRAVVAQLETTE